MKIILKNLKKINKKFIFGILINNWYLILLFIAGLVLRTVYLSNIVGAGFDQVNHLTWAREIFSNHGYLWHGAENRRAICNGQLVNPFLGPFYIYLLIIPALFNHWNFLFASVMNAILNAVAIFFLYYLTKLITKSKTAGLIAATLFTFSTAFIISSGIIWNPFFLPIFIFITLIAFVKLIQGKERYLLVFILFLSLCTQLHASIFLFIPVLMLLWLIYKIKINRKILWLYGGILLIISYLPMIYHELINRFENSLKYYKLLFNSSGCGGEKLGYFHKIIHTVKGFFISLSTSLNGKVYETIWGDWKNQDLSKIFFYFLVILFLLLCLIIIIKTIKNLKNFHKEDNLLLIPVLLIFFFIVLSNFYSFTIWEYYYISVIPLVYIIFAYGFTKIMSNILGKIIVIALLTAFICLNVNSTVRYIQKSVNRTRGNVPAIDQIELLDFIKNDSQNQGARIDYDLTSKIDITGYQYFIDLHQIKTKLDGNIIYLIVHPKTIEVKDQLKGDEILIDKDFGNIRLIKYKDN